MAQKMTPVEAAKALNIRPQLVYGFIKHGRIKTYSNPAGKAALVDLNEVQAVSKSVKHHRPKDAKGNPIRRKSGVERGSLVSMHARFTNRKGAVKDDRPHRVRAVTGLFKGEEADYAYVTDAEGRFVMMYDEDTLAQMVAKKQCHIESPASLLSALMFHWRAQKDEAVQALASSLEEWCQANEVHYAEFRESDAIEPEATNVG